jgi:AhpD family alkylhydroperoxidase
VSHTRINLPHAAPDAYRAIGAVETYVRGCGLDPSLIELVKLRASQINGCAFCMDMHSKDARRTGETEQRLFLLSAWREVPFYSEREQAALAWSEHLTRLSTDGAPQSAYERLTALFSPAEIANLTVLIGLINLWNRIGVGFQLTPAAAA